MEIVDFLPKYPEIHTNEYESLQFYPNFYESLFRKKEFYENKLERTEEPPREKGILMKHQKTIARYMSSHTPYDKLLLIHSMGTGKTCSAIGAIEQIIEEDTTKSFRGALILAKGENIIDNFRNELVNQCTDGKYLPPNFETENQKIRRIKKATAFYEMNTFIKFSRDHKSYSTQNLRTKFSNYIIVIDEIHNLRIQEDKKDSEKVYQFYHKFLHAIEGCKIMFLSGTPMKDDPSEIASVMNLLLPLDQQLPTGRDFIDTFMIPETEEKESAYILNTQTRDYLKNVMKGYVSFLKEAESTVRRVYLGEIIAPLSHFTVYPLEMSEFQSRHYLEALERDSENKGVFNNSREANLFVFPDGSYGSAGFEKYIERTKKVRALDLLKKSEKESKGYFLREDFKKLLKGKSNQETILNISEYSIVYSELLRKIEETQGCCFIYNTVVNGGGCRLFSKLLELLGYSKAKGSESTRKKRYALLTSETASLKELNTIKARFNSYDNTRGDYIKVIIGSRAVSEGFTFKNVIFEGIATPHWNYSETAQAIARGIRLGSHNDLIEQGYDPTVEIMQTVAIPKKSRERKLPMNSIDFHMYLMSEIKDRSIRSILRFLMEISFDCALNYIRNRAIEGSLDGSRECDYTYCDYTCEGINKELIETIIPESALDRSTYNIYYSNPNIKNLYREIQNLYTQDPYINLDDIIRTLKGTFTEEEIIASLTILAEENDVNETFSEVYFDQKIGGKSKVYRMTTEIRNLFRESFRFPLSTIYDRLKETIGDIDAFEMLYALRNMINTNIPIRNRFGFTSYLRESNDIFYLIDDIGTVSDFLCEYYCRIPHAVGSLSEKDIIDSFLDNRSSRIIADIFSGRLPISSIESLPISIRESILEACIVSELLEMKVGSEVRDDILEQYKIHIKRDDNTIFSLLSQSEGILRCLNINEIELRPTSWKNCTPEELESLRTMKNREEEKQRDSNPYGVLVKINRTLDDGPICIVDLNKESVKRGRKDSDMRLVRTGTNCTSWNKMELMDIVVNKIQTVPDYEEIQAYGLEELSEEELNQLVERTALYQYLEQELPYFEQKGYSSEYTERRKLEFDLDQMPRETKYAYIIYDMKEYNKIKSLCQIIKNKYENEGLLIDDPTCGEKSKIKSVRSSSIAVNKLRSVLLSDYDYENRAKDIRKLLGIPRADLSDMREEEWYGIFKTDTKRGGIVGIYRQDGQTIKELYLPDTIPKKYQEEIAEYREKMNK